MRTLRDIAIGSAFAAALLGSGVLVAAAQKKDRHVDYYYPEVKTSEIYKSRSNPLPNANRRTRIGFTVGLNARQLKRAYPPQYHIFAKGTTGEKMIIIASGPGYYDTIFRLRALLAGLSSEARTSPLFRKARKPENLNFLDLAKMTGFKQITLTDGDKLAHRIDLE